MLLLLFVLSMLRHHPRTTLFPYTTLFRSGNDVVGSRTRIKVVKNKLAPPFKEVEVDVLYGRGIWAAADLVDRALDLGVLDRKSTRLNSSHLGISYAVFCLKKKKKRKDIIE